LTVDFFYCVTSQMYSAAAVDQFEAEELEDEELGHAETYADYMPAKCEPQLPAVYLFRVVYIVCRIAVLVKLCAGYNVPN